MKKRILLLLGAVILCGFFILHGLGLFGSHPYSLHIDADSIAKIELSKSGTSVFIDNRNDINNIVSNLNSLVLRPEKQLSTGYIYKLCLLDEHNEVITDFTVHSGLRLYGRKIVEGQLDLTLLDTVYNQNAPR